jgi:hypothetical protein
MCRTSIHGLNLPNGSDDNSEAHDSEGPGHDNLNSSDDLEVALEKFQFVRPTELRFRSRCKSKLPQGLKSSGTDKAQVSDSNHMDLNRFRLTQTYEEFHCQNPSCKNKFQRSMLPCRQGIAKCLYRVMACPVKVLSASSRSLKKVMSGICSVLSMVSAVISAIWGCVCASARLIGSCAGRLANGVCTICSVAKLVAENVKKGCRVASQYFATEGTCGHSCLGGLARAGSW